MVVGSFEYRDWCRCVSGEGWRDCRLSRRSDGATYYIVLVQIDPANTLSIAPSLRREREARWRSGLRPKRSTHLRCPMSTLSQDAQDIFMTHRCPRCGHRTTRQGSSFRSVRHYHCSACGEQVRLTYNDKLKLFREHAVEAESAV